MQRFRNSVLNSYQSNPDFNFLTLLSEGEYKTFTVRELVHRIYDYCRFYQEKGVKHGDTVLIILKESLDLYASFFAGLVYGALPAYFAYPSPKQSVERFLDSVYNLVEYNSIRLVISFGEVSALLGAKGAIADKDFLGCFNYESVAFCNSDDINEFKLPGDEAFLQFSSGTTGAKKGVKISSEALFNQIHSYDEFVKFDSESKIVSWLPHYHDMGLIACMLMPFVKRVPVVMISPFEWVKNPKILLDAVTRFRATHLWQPNFALGHLTKSVLVDELKRFDLSSVRQLVLCSEPALYETVQKFLQNFEKSGLNSGAVYNCYAMAENTFAMTSTNSGGIGFIEIDTEFFRQFHKIREKTGGRKISSAGVPLSNVEVVIRDDEGNSLPEDSVGEVTIKSNCMLDCYHNNPEETEKAFVEGFFKTGDLGFFHKGELYITGRKKDLIIVGGENIYPQDIELILNEVDYLIPGRNVVFGVEDERVGTERVVILAELKDGVVSPDTTGLRTKIVNALNISVSDIVLLPHMRLRKGTAGKISRYLNKQEYLKGAFAVNSSAIDGNKPLKDIVAGVIPFSVKPHIDNSTPLFSSGIIDSFGFVDLICAIEKGYNVSIPESLWKMEFFQTIDIISQTIADVQNKRIPDDVPVSDEECENKRGESLDRLKSRLTVIPGRGPLMERVINHFPLKGSFWFNLLFRMAGIRLGRNVKFLGRVRVKLRGKPENIVIGDNAIIGDNVDIRNRENGKIILKERVYLDHNVRIVAARDGMIEVGIGTEVGGGTMITSGGITKIGEFCLIAGNVNINSSRHGTERECYVKEQPHTHGFIEIGDDVWIGSGASILINSKLNRGVVVSSNSLVSGEIPPFAICTGVPAKVIRYR